MARSPDELLQPHNAEHDAFRSLALQLVAESGLLLALTLYKRLDAVGRRILIETTREVVEKRL